MTVCGCTRTSTDKDVTNGVCYVIEEYTDTEVKLSVHPDNDKSHLEHVDWLKRCLDEVKDRMEGIVKFLLEKQRTYDEFMAFEGMQDELQEGRTVTHFLVRLGFGERRVGTKKKNKTCHVAVPIHFQLWANNPSEPLTLPKELVETQPFKLKWNRFQETMRLTHALPYVYYQGKTLAKKTLWLMNVKSKHFTMRHLVMGLGRVQEAKFVKICGPGRERMVLQAAQEAYDAYEKRAQNEAEAQAAAAAGEALMADMDCEDDGNDEPMDFDDPFADVDFDD